MKTIDEVKEFCESIYYNTSIESFLKECKNHQMMIQESDLTIEHKFVIFYVCYNIMGYLLKESHDIRNTDDKMNKINTLASHIDPRDTEYWWGLYDDTYSDFLSSETIRSIHSKLYFMYDRLVG